MIKTRLTLCLGNFLTIALISLGSINFKSDKLPEFLSLQPAAAQQQNFDFLKCAEDCLQLPTDNRFRNLPISQRLINRLPKWNNICSKLVGKNICGVAKTYQFKDGTISLKVMGTEGFSTDIKFNSGIRTDRAIAIARQSFNAGKAYAKTENLNGRIVLYSSPFDNGGETIYLQETYLILNARNQVNRIISMSTTP